MRKVVVKLNTYQLDQILDVIEIYLNMKHKPSLLVMLELQLLDSLYKKFANMIAFWQMGNPNKVRNMKLSSLESIVLGKYLIAVNRENPDFQIAKDKFHQLYLNQKHLIEP